MADTRGKNHKILYISLGVLGVFLIIIATVSITKYIVKEPASESGDDLEEKVVSKTILWGYKCENKKCVKYKLTTENKGQLKGFSHCRILCDTNALLWPLPRDTSTSVTRVKEINIKKVEVQLENFMKNQKIWEEMKSRFEGIISKKASKKFVDDPENGAKLSIRCSGIIKDAKIDYEIDESYKITTFTGETQLSIAVDSTTFNGCRHGLETITQMIFYDEVAEKFFIQLRQIKDSPKYKHRGISIDTSRHFYPVESLKKNINAMAMVKMNRFHWHISDSQSFPFLLKSHPDIAINSAYSVDKMYTNEDVREVIEYGKSRGVHVYIEIDMPGHIGEGFAYKNLTSCFGHTLDDYCLLSKPCGQLDPSIDEVYQVLEDIYHEIYELYDGDTNIAHLGGDEVFFRCWNESSQLQAMMTSKGWNLGQDGFMEVWGYFQQKVIESVEKAFGKKVPIIIWSSTLTQMPYLTKYLDKENTIIQMWTSKTVKADVEENRLVLENGYKIIVSNYDTLYLDCGFGTWVRNAPDWCAPYHNWMEIYDFRMEDFSGEEYVNQVLGAEASIWSEQITETELDGRIWPRLSALAERLWNDPATNKGYRDAESRMLYHREQLVEIGGVHAAAIQPEWCLLNQGICPK